MMKVTVLYGNPTSADEFEKHYHNVHMPLAVKMKGVARVELTKLISAADGGKPPFYRMAELYFSSEEQMKETLQSPEGKATVDDISQLATGGATVMIGRVDD